MDGKQGFPSSASLEGMGVEYIVAYMLVGVGAYHSVWIQYSGLR